MKIVIFKNKKVLEIWQTNKVYNRFLIGIGKEESGHKQCEGDLKTPLGKYRICVKNPKSKYHLSLGLNYPNNEDATMAYAKNKISKQELHQICTANDCEEIPLWSTSLGGKIYIHGELESKPWSEGCIRMYNKDIETLYNIVPLGTPVIIKP